MRCFVAVLVAAAAFFVSGAAETINDYLPECAIDCINTAIGDATTCGGPDDLECFCIADNYRAIYTSGVNCVLQACGNDVSVGEVLPAAARMCEIVVERSGNTVTSVNFPTSTSSTTPTASENTAPTDPPGSTTTDDSDSGAVGLGAGVFAVVAPFAFAAVANL
ncbi:putative GPI-anchored protein 7 [Madurella mycetomatis]|uniref:GPI-anchored protein 7 n=1 Tax=Madurella mycetomatis TaxID=100816 RepID=A0A175VRU3_9PEZI|nr:putative GPI-anchored protein 7 [Madurella mycetomatis]